MYQAFLRSVRIGRTDNCLIYAIREVRFIFCYFHYVLFSGLCIPANNTLFIVGISEKLAAKEPQLTLEVRRLSFLRLLLSGSSLSYTIKLLLSGFQVHHIHNSLIGHHDKGPFKGGVRIWDD